MRTLLIVFLTLGLSAFADNASVNLAWDDPNTDPDIAGYRVYVGTEHGVYGKPVNCSTKESTLELPIGTFHYAVVTVVNTSGIESLPCAELVFQVFKPGEGKIPSPPTGLRKVSSMRISIERSEDLQVWSELYAALAQESSAQAMYRLVLVSQ